MRSYFDHDVVSYLEDLRSQTRETGSWPPVLVYSGGQPGAGKSRANERAAKARPSLVPVIGDDLRQFHPDYARLMREDPLSMPAVTAQASGQWIGMAADYLREQRSDVLIETTLRSGEAMAQTISAFRQAGYVVELRVIAVPHEVSRLSTVERYTRQVEDVGVGRWTPAAAHDEAYGKAVGTVEELIASGRVDRLVIEDRAGSVLLDQSYFGFRDRELAQAGRRAAAAFERARSVEKMTPEAARGWLDLAREQIERVRTLTDTTPDLLDTVRTIATVDAHTVAVRAWPQDPECARTAGDALTALLPHTDYGRFDLARGVAEARQAKPSTEDRAAARRALGQRIEREVDRRRSKGRDEGPHRDVPPGRGRR